MAKSDSKAEGYVWPALAVDQVGRQWFVVCPDEPLTARAVDGLEGVRPFLKETLITVEELGTELGQAFPGKPIKVLSRLEGLARGFGNVYEGAQLIVWVGSDSSFAALMERGKLTRQVSARPDLTMRDVWNREVSSNQYLHAWMKNPKRAAKPEVLEPEFEKFLECVRTGTTNSVGGSKWFIAPYKLPESVIAAFRQLRLQIDPESKAKRVILGGYAACHLDLAGTLRREGMLVLPESPEPEMTRCVIGLKNYAKDNFSLPVDVELVGLQVAAMSSLMPIRAYRAALDSVNLANSGELKSRLVAIAPWTELVTKLSVFEADLKKAVVPSNLPEGVRLLQAQVETAAKSYQPRQYFDLLDAAANDKKFHATELMKVLEIQLASIPSGARFAEKTMDRGATEGHGSEEFVKSVEQPGYVTVKGVVSRKARVKIERRSPPPPRPANPPVAIPDLRVQHPPVKPPVPPAPTFILKPQRRLFGSTGRKVLLGALCGLILWIAYAMFGPFGADFDTTATINVPATVVGIVPTATGQRIAVITGGGKPGLHLFLTNGQRVKAVIPLLKTVVAVSPDGSRFAVENDQLRPEVWDSALGSTIKEMGDENSHHTDSINAMIFLPAGSTLVSGANDHTMRVWDTSTGHQLQSFNTEDAVVSLSAGSNTLVAGEEEGDQAMVQIWTRDGATGDVTHFKDPVSQQLPLNQGNDSRAPKISVSADGARFVVSAGKQLWFWDGTLHSLKDGEAPVKAVAISSDGNTILAGVGSEIWAWHWDRDKRSVDEGKHYSAHSGAVSAVAFIPGINRWASGAEDGSVKIWEIR